MMLVAMVMEYLVSAATPARGRYPVATSKRYSKQMFELSHPIFTKEQPPLSRPFMLVKRDSGKQAGFFVQGKHSLLCLCPPPQAFCLLGGCLHDVCVKD